MRNTIRAFIAIEIEEPIRNELLLVQDQLRESGADVKWTEPHNIHLTLKFLNDIAAADVATINQIMTKTAADIPAFKIDITELGAFPDILFPKIIWAGITRNADILSKIVTNLEPGLKALKIKKEEKEFTAHITLGRIRSSREKDKLCAALEETNIPSGLSQTVDHLTLFQSTLTPQGPVYTSLLEIPLKNP